MLRGILLSSALSVLFSFITSPLLLAQAIQVKVIGPASTHTTHDITTIALDLGEMLKAAPGYSGSSASATVLEGRSLMESYYHPEQKGATRTALDAQADYVVIVPEVYFLHWIPEATFDGVLQMSRRALNAGSTPLLLMPRGDTYPLSVLSENSYRIGNGSGIATVPGGHAVNSATGLSSPGTDTLKLRKQAYLLAATLFNQITGLNAATGTTYAPADVGNATVRSDLAGKAATAVTTHASTIHYTTSRHLSGIASYRTITPPNNRVRYAFTGTSTENGIGDKLDELIQASGHIAAPHARPTSDGQTWTQAVFDRTKSTFDAAPNEYLFLYGRDTQISAQSLISYNQANLVPIFVDRHYDGVQTGDLSTRILLRDLHERTDHIFSYNYYQGWKGMFLHLGHARLNDVDSSIIYSGDGTHMTSENYYMAAAMMFTSVLGKDPTAPAGLTAKQLKGFKVGNQMAKELAFLSETTAYTPESTLAAVPPTPLTIARWETFSRTFTATGGTPPYTWSESSASGLPAGLTLSAAGVLSGAVTSSPKLWNLVLKATDSTGAISKVPFELNVTTGAGSLAVTQTTSYTAVIPPGGPASSATATYTLQNPGLTSINWTASKTQPWITLSSFSGVLAAGASVNVIVSMNSGVNVLAIGTHTDTITFANTTGGFGNTTRGVSLRVSAPPVISAGSAREFSLNATTPWTPDAINPVGWYDASDASTVTQAAGLVSEWRSKVGTSHMLQATASKQPLIGTTQINGLNTIKFDGDVDAFKTAANPFGTSIRDAMVMTVANIGSLTGTMFSLSGSSTDANRWQADAANSTGNVVFDCGGSSGSSRLSFSSGWSANQNKLLGFYSSEKAKVQQVWESGLLRASDVTGNTAAVNSGMALGNNGANTDDNCAMGEVVIINDMVADVSRQGLEGYLAHKWGFATTLPTNHPYRTVSIGAGTLVNLSGITASDADNDPLDFTWTVVSAPNGFTIGDVSGLTPKLFFSLPGTYTLRLTVSDAYSETREDVVIQVVQNLPPVANAGANQSSSLLPAWTPETLNPVGWYDATDATTITQSGGFVSEWRSKIGTFHMKQATSANQPQVTAAMINGLSAIKFDGDTDSLKTATNPFGTQIRNAMFMGVVNVGSISNTTVMFTLSGGYTAPNNWLVNAPDSSNNVVFDCGGTSGANRVTTAAGWSANQNKMLGFYCSTTDNVQQIWNSGTLLKGDATGHAVGVNSGIVLGNNGTHTDDNCSMGEVFIINGVVSTVNRQGLEGYLAHKWKMESTLPGNHPYQSAPPGYVSISLNGLGSDPNNDPVTYQWSLVSGPSGSQIKNSDSQNASFLTNTPGLYTLRLTVSDGVLQTSDDLMVNVMNEGQQFSYESWSIGTFVNSFTLTGVMDDPDGDGVSNLLEFAFGTDPTSSNNGTLSYVAGGDITSLGAPLLLSAEGQPGVFQAVFTRRKDHASTGITYRALFSADLKIWTASAAGLSVLTATNSAGDMEVVSIPLPSVVPIEAGGTRPSTFFRVEVISN